MSNQKLSSDLKNSTNLVNLVNIQKLQTKLEEGLQDRYSLCRQKFNSTDNTLSCIIVTLHKNNYQFKREEFDKYIICVSCKKSQGCLAYMSNENNHMKKAMTIMFTIFSPTPKQFELLCSCYKNIKYNKTYVWLDAMVSKKYNFSKSEIEAINHIGFDITSIVLLQNTNISLNNLLLCIIKYVEKKNNSVNVTNLLMSFKNNNDFPPNFINNILDKFKVIFNDDGTKISEKIDRLVEVITKIINISNNIQINDDTFKIILQIGSIELFLKIIKLNKNYSPDETLMILCSESYNMSDMVLYLHKQYNLKITTQIMNNMLCTKQYFHNIYRNNTNYTILK